MPSAADDLRKKFMTPRDRDGIDTCINIIRNAGGNVEGGIIVTPTNDFNPEVEEAVGFLVCEWDFDVFKGNN